MQNAILEARNISKAYVGVQALDQVSLTINKGEIHCLAGENGSGKSTMVKIAAGVVRPDAGEIFIDGQPVNMHSYRALEAIQAGIQVIYQDLSLFSHLSAAENIAVNKLIAEKRRLVNSNSIRQIAQQQLEQIGVAMDLNATVQEMSIANRQLVAICRALTLNTKLIFMDEPTTALTNKEVDRLMAVVMGLKQKGISVVFISHKLDEIFRISDNVTIFRDGKKVGDFAVNTLTQKKLAFHMTGRDIEYPRYQRRHASDETVLKVEHLSKARNFTDISFNIRRGDILGLTGLLGSGRTELALALFGLNPPDNGSIQFKGKTIRIGSPAAAIRAGIGLLPDDRTTAGLFMDKSIKDNITSAILDKLKNKFGILAEKPQVKYAQEAIASLNIRTHSMDKSVRTLSGGNAQKTVLAKWANTRPELFILDMPTVGVDIGAKVEIYQQIQRFADSGMGIILISDEIDEIIANCNRVLVMSQGRISAALTASDLATPDIRTRLNELIYNKPIDNATEDPA